MTWQPIETIPKDCRLVLFATEYDGRSVRTVAKWDGEYPLAPIVAFGLADHRVNRNTYCKPAATDRWMEISEKNACAS